MIAVVVLTIRAGETAPGLGRSGVSARAVIRPGPVAFSRSVDTASGVGGGWGRSTNTNPLWRWGRWAVKVRDPSRVGDGAVGSAEG